MPSERRSRAARKELAKLNEETETRLQQIEQALVGEPIDEQGGSITISQRVELNSYSGPLPHPELLHKYEQVLPGLADRIVSMAERQSAHRQELERTVVNSDVRRSNLGLLAAFLITVMFLSASVALVVNGHEVAGATLGSVNIVGLVYAFINGKRKQDRELKEKETERKRTLEGSE